MKGVFSDMAVLRSGWIDLETVNLTPGYGEGKGRRVVPERVEGWG